MSSTLTIGEAFEKWADDLTSYAAALVGPDDAADIVHQAFVDTMASGRWPEVRDPRAYLFRATLNAARSQHRSHGRRRAREWRATTQSLVHHELLADPAVVDAVNELSLQQRAVIFLAYWDDLTPAAIADVLGVSDGTVRRQLARARAKLRKVLMP